jgi:hypothetical protein
MPRRIAARLCWVKHAGESVRVVVWRQEAPPWMVKLDPEILPLSFGAVASGRLGPVVGTGRTADEAIDHVRRALRAEALLTPKGRG